MEGELEEVEKGLDCRGVRGGTWLEMWDIRSGGSRVDMVGIIGDR